MRFLVFIIGMSFFAYGMDEEIPAQTLPHSHSFEVRFSLAQMCYKYLWDQLKTGSNQERHQKIVTFYKDYMKPLGQEILASSRYFPLYSTMLSNLMGALYETRFLLATEQKIDSKELFDRWYKSFDYLSSEHKRKHQDKVQCLLNQGLQYRPTIKQLCALGQYAHFLPEHSQFLYKSISAKNGDQQLADIKKLLTIKSFANYMTSAITEQGSPHWQLYVRTCLINDKHKLLYDLFKMKDGRIADSLFMYTMIPFLHVQKVQYQETLHKLLFLWSHTPCPDTCNYQHARYEKVASLIESNASFKQLCEPARIKNPYIAYWLGDLYMQVWCAKKAHGSSHSQAQREQAQLLKKINDYFSWFSDNTAQELGVMENKTRLASHGVMLKNVLSEPRISEKSAATVCERALKAGLNIAKTDIVAKIAPYISSNAFITMVKPYCASDIEILYSLGCLYEQGFMVEYAGRRLPWLVRDLQEAQKLYQQAFAQQHVKSFLHLLAFKGKDDSLEVEEFCNEACTRFPYNPSFLIQQAQMFCNIAGDAETLEKCIAYRNKTRLCVQKLEEYIPTFSKDEKIWFPVLQANLLSVDHMLKLKADPTYDEEAGLHELVEQVYDTCNRFVQLNKAFFAGNIFRPSVLEHLKSYAQKIMSYERSTLTQHHLQAVGLAGYVMLHGCIDQHVLSTQEINFLEALTDFGLKGDATGAVAPMGHVLALVRSLKDRKEYGHSLYDHILRVIRPDEQSVSDPEKYKISQLEGLVTLESLAEQGCMRSQVILAMINQDTMIRLLSILPRITKKVLPIHASETAQYAKLLQDSKVYTLLKKNVLDGACTHCRLEFALILSKWLFALLANAQKTDVSLRPFYDDQEVIMSHATSLQRARNIEMKS